MEACINHEDHAAIEHCEVCAVALCDLCLWYDDEGRRLCEQHAREYEKTGGSVQSPALYAEGIQVREADGTRPRAPYEGNQTDLIAAAAGLLGAVSLLTWFGGGMCIPMGAGVLGLIALTNKRKGLNPERARMLSLFGVGLSVVSVLPVLMFACFFAFFVGLAIAGGTTGP